ncbi:MAG: 4-hydroxy-tetrahydrodipicolinate reductase, partial [Gammaproteobacteria bacterium]
MATHQNEKIRVIVNGAQGRMGQETVNAVNQDPELDLVAACGHQDDLIKAIRKNQAQVVIDFTTPSAVYEN